MSEEKKSKIEGWRNEYLQKYKRMTGSTDNLFKLTNPQRVLRSQHNASLSRANSMDDCVNPLNSFAEMNRIRVENIKQEHLKHQSKSVVYEELIRLRRQEELQRRVESANNVKQEKI